MNCELCHTKSKYMIDSCFVNKTLMLIGSKWVLPIILELEIRKSVRFNQLQKLLAPISAKILSKRLNNLQENDLVRKDVISDFPTLKVSYSLTKKGKEFMSCVLPILEFGEKYEQIKCNVTSKMKSELPIAQPKHDSFLHV